MRDTVCEPTKHEFTRGPVLTMDLPQAGTWRELAIFSCRVCGVAEAVHGLASLQRRQGYAVEHWTPVRIGSAVTVQVKYGGNDEVPHA